MSNIFGEHIQNEINNLNIENSKEVLKQKKDEINQKIKELTIIEKDFKKIYDSEIRKIISKNILDILNEPQNKQKFYEEKNIKNYINQLINNLNTKIPGIIENIIDEEVEKSIEPLNRGKETINKIINEKTEKYNKQKEKIIYIVNNILSLPDPIEEEKKYENKINEIKKFLEFNEIQNGLKIFINNLQNLSKIIDNLCDDIKNSNEFYDNEEFEHNIIIDNYLKDIILLYSTTEHYKKNNNIFNEYITKKREIISELFGEEIEQLSNPSTELSSITNFYNFFKNKQRNIKIKKLIENAEKIIKN